MAVFPGPTARPTSSRRRRVVVLGGVAGALALGAAAVVLAAGPGSDDAPTFPLQNADLALEVPVSWSERRAPQIPGLDPKRAVAAAHRGSDAYIAAQLVAGQADSTLLPPKLRAALEDRTPEPKTVGLAGGESYRYDTLALRGVPGLLTVHATLTSQGVAIVACRSLPGADANGCARMADTLTLKSAAHLPIELGKPHRATLDDVFVKLGRELNDIRGELPKARTSTGRSNVARRLSDAYEGALVRLDRSPRNPLDAGLNATLAASFSDAASAFARVSRAYRKTDDKAFNSALTAVARSRKKIAQALTALRKAGYSKRLPSLPTPPRIIAGKTATSNTPAPAPSRRPAPSSSPPPQTPPSPAPWWSDGSDGSAPLPPPSSRPPTRPGRLGRPASRGWR